MFCPNCGTKLPEGHAFCANCGAQTNRQASAPPQSPSAASGPVHPQPATPQTGAARSAPSALIIGGVAALVFAVGLGSYLAVRVLDRAPVSPPTGSATAPPQSTQPNNTPAPAVVAEPDIVPSAADVAAPPPAGTSQPPVAQPAAFQATVTSTPKQQAYIDLINGDVGFQRGDDPQGQWTAAAPNTPLAPGDSLNAATKDSRAEIQVGDGNVVRLGDQATAAILQNSDDIFQLKVTSGLATVRAQQLSRAYEIDTPELSLLPQQSGEYQVQVDAQGGTNVTVSQGKALVTTQQGQQLLSAPASVQVAPGAAPMPSAGAAPDAAFTQWNQGLDTQANQSPSQQNVPPGVPGTTDLDQSGHWVPYGNGMAWVPNGVTADWQPYQVGRWVWEPYGWTWVSDEPWGWAPYHYGSWALAAGVGWVWVPGSRLMRPAYAPARVVFVANGDSFGWFPLGPGEVYVSMYDVGFAPRPVIGFVNYRHVLVINRGEMVGVHYRYARVDYHEFDHAQIARGIPRDVVPDRRFMFAREADLAPRVDRRFVPPAGRDRPIVVVHPVPVRPDLNGRPQPQGHTIPVLPPAHQPASPPHPNTVPAPGVTPDNRSGQQTKPDQTKTNQKTDQTKNEPKADPKKAPPCPKAEPGKPAPKGCGGLFKHF
jgi:hypothetical protein